MFRNRGQKMSVRDKKIVKKKEIQDTHKVYIYILYLFNGNPNLDALFCLQSL